MNEDTYINEPNALVQLAGFVAYALARSLYLAKVLIPLWIKRIAHGIQYDAWIARQVYRGNNIRLITVGDEVKVNNYHTRYEGTEREAVS